MTLALPLAEPLPRADKRVREQHKLGKRLLDAWEQESPGRIETIARALGDIRPSQLSDPKLFDFLSLGKRGNAPLPDAHAWLVGDRVGAA